jgi:hypothetical protein
VVAAVIVVVVRFEEEFGANLLLRESNARTGGFWLMEEVELMPAKQY